MSPKRKAVPEKTVAKLRAICLALPEAYEETAWVGTRWLIRKKTFAHVVMIDKGWPPAYARAARTDGPACVITFQSIGRSVDPETFSQAPYFSPPWQTDIVGRILSAGARTDWTEIAGLIAGSYCMLAPKKLADAVRANR